MAASRCGRTDTGHSPFPTRRVICLTLSQSTRTGRGLLLYWCFCVCVPVLYVKEQASKQASASRPSARTTGRGALLGGQAGACNHGAILTEVRGEIESDNGRCCVHSGTHRNSGVLLATQVSWRGTGNNGSERREGRPAGHHHHGVNTAGRLYALPGCSPAGG